MKSILALMVGWIRPLQLCMFVLVLSPFVTGNAVLAAPKSAAPGPEKAGQTADIPLESLSPKPRPTEPKAKETLEAAKRRLDADIAAAPVLPPVPDIACKGEALSLCADAVGRDLHQCLGDNVSKLSKLCKSALRPYVTELVRTSCSADAQIECSGMGQADVVTCLLQMESMTSIPCRAALALWPRAFRAAAGATNPAKNAQAAKGTAQ